MTRVIDKEEIKGNCDRSRKCAEGDFDAADNEGGIDGCCEGGACHHEWTDD